MNFYGLKTKLSLQNDCWRKVNLLRAQKPKMTESKSILHERKCSNSSQPRIHTLRIWLIFWEYIIIIIITAVILAATCGVWYILSNVKNTQYSRLLM